MVSRSSVLKSLAAAAVGLFFIAGSSFAFSWFSHSPKEKSTDVDITSTVKLENGKVLSPGTYHVSIPLNTKAPEVKFFEGGKLVATAPAKAVTEPSKNSDTELEFDREGNSEFVTKLQIAGMKDVLVFNAPASASSVTKSGS